MLPGRTAFFVALAIWIVTAIGAQLLRHDGGEIAGPIAAGLVITAVLLAFTQRGHAWPRWVLAGLLILGTAFALVGFDRVSPLAVLDAVGLTCLWRSQQLSAV